jgi:hypothetical protein
LERWGIGTCCNTTKLLQTYCKLVSQQFFLSISSISFPRSSFEYWNVFSET